MIRIAAALLLFGSAAYAQELDGQTKTNALKVGYALNGNNMVKWGSIDLTSLGGNIIPPVVVAQEPPKAEIKKRVRESRKYRRRRR